VRKPDESPEWTADERRFVQNMRRLRAARGVSQTELARRVSALGVPGFHQQTVTRIEAGDRPVRLNESTAIAAALGTDLEQMLVDPTPEALEASLAEFVSTFVSVWFAQVGEATEMGRLAHHHEVMISESLSAYLEVLKEGEVNGALIEQVGRILNLLDEIGHGAYDLAKKWSQLTHPAMRLEYGDGQHPEA
jgi:transcriptional regulator with XRE-family HTH domain